jgi:AcrR family transcriptional regulator
MGGQRGGGRAARAEGTATPGDATAGPGEETAARAEGTATPGDATAGPGKETASRGDARAYSSPLRERQREETRRRILEAVAALVAEGAIHTFSVQDVAKRAGISYPTVYRHFPTREALVAATYEWAAAVTRADLPPAPTSLDDLPAWMAGAIPVFEEHGTVSRALLVLLGALDIEPPSRRERDRLVARLVRRAAPGLGARRTRQAAAVVRFLAGSHAWATLRHRFGLDAADTSAALEWALQVLIADLQRPAAGAVAEGGRTHEEVR